jgi:hypothetical protein
MPEIGDVMDVTIDDLTPEQQEQLKDATDQFQIKCLMSFNKNRSGVPCLKSEMPRVLLPGEPDTTSFQEKEEALQAFRDTAKAVLGRHHTAFLGMFKQKMIGVFGPGMEKVFSRVSPHPSSAEVGETSSSQPTGAQPLLQGQPIQPPPQSLVSQPIQPPILKDRYGESEGGSEWEPIKILLEGDGNSNKMNTTSNTRLRLTTQVGRAHVATGPRNQHTHPSDPKTQQNTKPRVH